MAAGELDGERAFDMVLDRLTDAERNRRVEAERASEAKTALAAEQTRNRALIERASTLEKKVNDFQAGLPKLAEFYAAATGVRDLIAAKHDGERSLIDPYGPELVRLRKAMEDAADHCDQIPF